MAVITPKEVFFCGKTQLFGKHTHDCTKPFWPFVRSNMSILNEFGRQILKIGNAKSMGAMLKVSHRNRQGSKRNCRRLLHRWPLRDTSQKNQVIALMLSFAPHGPTNVYEKQLHKWYVECHTRVAYTIRCPSPQFGRHADKCTQNGVTRNTQDANTCRYVSRMHVPCHACAAQRTAGTLDGWP
jgi:hypothetical protein